MEGGEWGEATVERGGGRLNSHPRLAGRWPQLLPLVCSASHYPASGGAVGCCNYAGTFSW